MKWHCSKCGGANFDEDGDKCLFCGKEKPEDSNKSKAEFERIQENLEKLPHPTKIKRLAAKVAELNVEIEQMKRKMGKFADFGGFFNWILGVAQFISILSCLLIVPSFIVLWLAAPEEVSPIVLAYQMLGTVVLLVWTAALAIVFSRLRRMANF